MSSHQCPRCELRFTWQTELDYHCREEHPDFRHEYHTRSAGDTAQPRTTTTALDPTLDSRTEIPTT